MITGCEECDFLERAGSRMLKKELEAPWGSVGRGVHVNGEGRVVVRE